MEDLVEIVDSEPQESLVIDKNRKSALFFRLIGIRRPMLEVHILDISIEGDKIINGSTVGIDRYSGNLRLAAEFAYDEWKRTDDKTYLADKVGEMDHIR